MPEKKDVVARPPKRAEPRPDQYISLATVRPTRQVVKLLSANCPVCGGLAWWCGSASELPTQHLIAVKTCSGCGFYKYLPCQACQYIADELAKSKSKRGADKLGVEVEVELEAIGA